MLSFLVAIIALSGLLSSIIMLANCQQWQNLLTEFTSDNFTITKSNNKNWTFIPFPDQNVTSLPQDLYSDCGQQMGHRIFGGYGIFMGCNQSLGANCGQRYKVQKKLTNVAPHFQMSISFDFFKIDSWQNEYAYLLVNNNETNETYFQNFTINNAWGPCSGEVDLCGAKLKPQNLATNPSFMDQIYTFNQTFDHNVSFIIIQLFANITDPSFSSWGFRNFKLDIRLCHPTCKLCSNDDSNSCLDCYTGSSLPENVTEGNCTCVPPNVIMPSFSCGSDYKNCNKCKDLCPKDVPNVIGTYLSNITSTNSSQCDLCSDFCVNCENSTFCNVCFENYYRNQSNSSNIVCEKCPDGTYLPPGQDQNCTECNPGCAECQLIGNNQTNCSRCYSGFVQYMIIGGYNNYLCKPCHPYCQVCDNNNTSQCSSCKLGFFLYQQECLTSCPSQMAGSILQRKCILAIDCEQEYYFDSYSGTCQSCHPDAQLCFGPFVENVIECKPGKFFYGPQKKCLTNCPPGYDKIYSTNQCGEKYKPTDSVCNVACQPGYQFDENLWSCQICPGGCGFCPVKALGSVDQCISCNQPTYFQNSQCISTCYSNFFKNDYTLSCVSKNTLPSSLTGVFLNQTTSVYQICHKSCATQNRTCLDSSPCCAIDEVGHEFYDPFTQQCQQCHYTCKTCIGAATVCTSCFNNTSYYRMTNKTSPVNGTCPCDDGYGDDQTTLTCAVCHPRCLNCVILQNITNETMCTTCSFPRVIQYNGNYGECVCTIGYYSFPNESSIANQTCYKCPYQCQTCKIEDVFEDPYNISSPKYEKLQCTSCPPSQTTNRVLFDQSDNNTHLCKCKDRFFDNGKDTICQNCHYSCKSCVNPGNDISCLECPALNTYNRDTINTSNSSYGQLYKCPCLSNFFDQRLMKCPACHYTCLECSMLATHCISCPNNTFRYLDKTTYTCPCQEGYFGLISDNLNNITQNMINRKCLPCHYSCAQCNGPLAEDCENCPDERYYYRYTEDTIIPGKLFCVCNKGYFEYQTSNNINITNYNYENQTLNYLLKRCQRCHYSCLACQGVGSLNCTECDQTWNRVSDFRLTTLVGGCPCNTPNIDLGFPVCGTCLKACGDFCDEANQPEFCKQCPDYQVNHRLNNSAANGTTCPCQPGFYDIGEIACQQCHYSCLNCFGPTEQDCIACPANSSRLDIPNYRGECLCIEGYNDISEQTLCVTCHYSCLKCPEDSLNQCLECPDSLTTFRIDNSQLNLMCPCQDNYYDNGTAICVKCSFPCIKCTNQYACLSCEANYLLYNGTCVVSCPGTNIFINNELRICGPCHSSCLNCTGPESYQCQACFGNQKLFQGSCIVCEETEHKMIDQTTGLCICNQAQHRIPVLKEMATASTPAVIACICDSYTFKNFYDKCEECNPNCLTCMGLATNCTSCEIWKNLTLSANGQCVCKNQHYQLEGNGTNSTCLITDLGVSLNQVLDTQGIRFPRVRLSFTKPVKLKPSDLIKQLIIEINGIQSQQYTFTITVLKTLTNSSTNPTSTSNTSNTTQSRVRIQAATEAEEYSQEFIIEFKPEVNFLKKKTLSIRWKDVTELRDAGGLPINQEFRAGISCQIGPYLLMDQSSFQYKQISDLISASSVLLEQNKENRTDGQNFFQFLRGSWFFCFLFNEMNFPVLLLMLSTVHPLNFYVYLQFFGSFVLWFIPDWQAVQPEYYNYKIFGQDFEKGNDGAYNGVMAQGIARLGISSSLIFNIGSILVIESVVAVLCLVFYLQYRCLALPKGHRTFIGTTTTLFNLLTRIIEVTFLLTTVSIMLNITILQLDSVIRATSLMIAIIMIICYIGFFYVTFNGIRQFDPLTYQMIAVGGGGGSGINNLSTSNQVIDMYYTFFCDIQLGIQRQFDNDERENKKINKIKQKVLYHWFNFLKKLVCTIAVTFVSDSLSQLIIIFIFHVFQILYTIYLWPCNTNNKNWIKLSEDITGMTIFLILIIHDQTIVSQILNDSLSMEIVDVMMSYGTALTVFFFLHFGFALILSVMEGAALFRSFVAVCKKLKDSQMCNWLLFWKSDSNGKPQQLNETENSQIGEIELIPQKNFLQIDKEDGRHAQLVMQKEKIFQKLKGKKDQHYGETIKEIQSKVSQWQQNPLFSQKQSQQPTQQQSPQK